MQKHHGFKGGNLRLIIALLVFSSSLSAGETRENQDLRKLNIEEDSITISGVSSGAYMAVQMQVAFSKLIKGVASIAGGPFWCAEGDKLKAQIQCMRQPNLIHIERQIEEAKRLAAENQIDDLSYLKTRRFYVFASERDSVTRIGNADKLVDFLSVFTERAHIRYDRDQNSAHGFPTLDYGSPCAEGRPPWLLQCQLDTAGILLESLYGSLLPRGSFVAENLHTFSQQPFKDTSTPLYSDGWIYIPNRCLKGTSCKLHVALHGCQMNPEDIQDQFVLHAGYNEWAESNGIVVLYPQSAKVQRENPYGCWDWFGFTGSNYVTRDGKQMAAIRSMIHRVSGL